MLKTLEELINIIRQRKNSSNEKSYTNKLLIDKKLSVNKVKEEISELLEAIEKNSNKVHETADVLYHLMVLLEENNIKIFILNNEYMGMVRQWQELLHEKNYSESYTAALPDFVKLAEAYGCVGIRAKTPDELDEKIKEMININKPVIFDCLVDKEENCFPMIPSGKPHNQMLLGPNDQKENKITGKGKTLV